jgi:hypothetical protein
MVHCLAALDHVPKGLKIANRANQVLFDSAWIAGVDYDDELFNDQDYDQEEDKDEEESNGMLKEYDKMDENELADIMDTAHDFNVPNEANCHDNNANATPVFENEEEDIVFKEEAMIVEDDTVNDDKVDDEDYEDSNQEDEPLEANGENPEAEDPNLRRIGRVRTPNPRYGYQHLHANATQTEEYTKETASVIAYV